MKQIIGGDYAHVVSEGSDSRDCWTHQAVHGMRRAAIAVLFTVALAVFAGTAGANSVSGAWLSPVGDNWPLVAVHAALTPDGRVLTFGSNSTGQATGLFSYDVWDPAAGLSGGHVTLPNLTGADTFCSYAVLLPTTGDILIAGGDLWNGTAVQKRGNEQIQYLPAIQQFANRRRGHETTALVRDSCPADERRNVCPGWQGRRRPGGSA